MMGTARGSARLPRTASAPGPAGGLLPQVEVTGVVLCVHDLRYRLMSVAVVQGALLTASALYTEAAPLYVQVDRTSRALPGCQEGAVVDGRKTELLRRYEELRALDMRRVTQQELQRRGQALEQLLFDLLEAEGLSPGKWIRRPGEEVDLSFTDGHRYFLVEAKWRKRVVVADIFAFRGKIEGRLIGTLGIFLDVADALSEEALNALTWGREINCVIFSGEDLRYALQPGHSFRGILEAKLRCAASYGEPNFPYKSFLDLQEIRP
jgi:hypothetical protein